MFRSKHGSGGWREARRLAVSVQQAVTSTALGSAWPAPLHASRQSAPELERVLDLADAAGPSRLPLRGWWGRRLRRSVQQAPKTLAKEKGP